MTSLSDLATALLRCLKELLQSCDDVVDKLARGDAAADATDASAAGRRAYREELLVFLKAGEACDLVQQLATDDNEIAARFLAHCGQRAKGADGEAEADARSKTAWLISLAELTEQLLQDVQDTLDGPAPRPVPTDAGPVWHAQLAQTLSVALAEAQTVRR